MRKLISTGSPFEKTAGYSRAVVQGDWCFVAGTTGYDYTTMTMPADVTSQSRNCFKTIEAALKVAGFAMADIVRATYYVTRQEDADALFAVCGGVLGEIRPAATLLVVAGLYQPEMKVEIEVTARTVSKLATQIGEQLRVERDRRAAEYEQRPLPRVATKVEPAPDLAAVFCDGGRMRTRSEGGGHGIHDPHWRETKNAAFHRMKSASYEVDPQPELPDCFRNQAYVEKLVLGLKKAKTPQPEAMARGAPAESPPLLEALPAAVEWQPETLFRTCLSSLLESDDFGPLMAAEADARGFYAAPKRAYLGDGQGYNWTIQQRWFPTFTPVADFVHVVEYLYEAAKALYPDEPAPRWQQYVAWATSCWQGRVAESIAELVSWAETGEASLDPRQRELAARLRTTAVYLTNNAARMDYPRYRREGLPVTSSLAESLVKQISKRVKGTEKFWNDGKSGEAILQIRAAILSHDNRLDRWLRERPVSPYAARCRPTLAISA